MRIEPLAIFHHVEQLSPEVIRAQRQAELRDIAEWRARHLRQVIDWSDPVKREARIAAAAAEEKFARELAAQQSSILDSNRSAASYELIGLSEKAHPIYRPVFRPLAERIKITPINKATSKRSWLSRLFRRK